MLTVISPDLTIFYQLLIDLPENGTGKDELLNHFKPCFYQDLSEGEQNTFLQWMQRYGKRRTGNATSQSIEQMRQANPRFILRNYLLHQSIEELERGDDSLFVKLQAAIKEPYSKRHEEFFQKRPDWASQKAGCSMLSCSS